jgi:nucleoside-diphosphate-sugar epimerase
MKILIIGGTRNIGHLLAQRFHEDGHHVTVLNRGVSQDDLPGDIARLRCDRTDRNQLKRALNSREFDMVIDMVLFRESEAQAVIDLLRNRVGHYVFISTGQVYLIRKGVTRPFKEEDYDGELEPRPEPNTYDYEEWLYGYEKRTAEDALAQAHRRDGFPYTSLRLPMVNGERDTFKRLYSYILRIRDGGPVLIPDEPGYPVRGVYSGDVVNAITQLLSTGRGKGQAYNLSQDETTSLTDLLTMLGELVGMEPRIQVAKRNLLRANGLLPDCSPFSDVWMSELDNSRSKSELGVTYTPLREYLSRIVQHYIEHPPDKPSSYRRRRSEKNLILPQP